MTTWKRSSPVSLFYVDVIGKGMYEISVTSKVINFTEDRQSNSSYKSIEFGAGIKIGDLGQHNILVPLDLTLLLFLTQKVWNLHFAHMVDVLS